MSKISPSKFCHGTQSSADAPTCCFDVKVPRNAIKQHKPYAYLSKTNLTCFNKIIAVQPSMAKYDELYTKLKKTMIIRTDNSYLYGIITYLLTFNVLFSACGPEQLEINHRKKKESYQEYPQTIYTDIQVSYLGHDQVLCFSRNEN